METTTAPSPDSAADIFGDSIDKKTPDIFGNSTKKDDSPNLFGEDETPPSTRRRMRNRTPTPEESEEESEEESDEDSD